MWHRGGELCMTEITSFSHTAVIQCAMALAAPGVHTQHESWHGDCPCLSVYQGVTKWCPAAVLVKRLSYLWDSQKSSLSLQNVHLNFQLPGSSAHKKLCHDCFAAFI